VVKLSGNIDLFKLARSSDFNFQQFSEEKAKDLLERIQIGDINGLAALAGAPKKKASRLIHKFNEEKAGIKERKVLQTSDTRRLKQDILSLFSEEASSQITKTKILSLTPTLDRKTIHERLATCQTGRNMFNELKQHGKLNEVRNILVDISLKTTAEQKTFGLKASDTIQYFISRKQVIKAAHTIMQKCKETQTLTSFFKDIEKRDLKNITKTLEEIEGFEVKDAEAIVSDAEVLINEQLRKGRVDEEKARRIVEDHIIEIVSALRMNWEEESNLRKAALERLSLPFEFDSVEIKRVIERWSQRQSGEQAAKLAQIEISLKGYWDLTEQIVERTILLDQMLATASMMEKYLLTIPAIGRGGIGFINGCNIFLLREQFEGRIEVVQPVGYSLGKTQSISITTPRNVTMLTGANSGGKTTLLTTLATISILTLLGLPVPCEKSEVTPTPIYLFRRRMTRKIGSLEQVLSSLIPIFADRQRKMVLMDEFEALTEPGAAGRIIATIMNRAATGSSLVLLVTHLARETLPHVKLPIRVDGIEARGLDVTGELIVNRQPKFSHLGSSTPKFIIKKLSKDAKKNRVKTLYEEVLSSLEGESRIPVQAPVNLPWISEEPTD
jgi:dsDNA-specific endonuclease/ATPase MutS2